MFRSDTVIRTVCHEISQEDSTPRNGASGPIRGARFPPGTRATQFGERRTPRHGLSVLLGSAIGGCSEDLYSPLVHKHVRVPQEIIAIRGPASGTGTSLGARDDFGNPHQAPELFCPPARAGGESKFGCMRAALI